MRNDVWITISIILVLLLLGRASFFTTVAVFEEAPAPVSSEQCGVISGICVPADQIPKPGYIEYGVCDVQQKFSCAVADLCEQTGGRYLFSGKFIDQHAFFEKNCACPFGMVYDFRSGCVTEFGR